MYAAHYNGAVTTAFARRAARIAALASLVALQMAVTGGADLAAADHPGALRSAPMSPALVGVIAGALALATGVVVIIIVKLLARKAPPPR
jgi:hypothetical protein